MQLQGRKIDSTTGDFMISNGQPVNEYTLLTAAYIRLKAPRLNWMYAPDTTYGSDYYSSHRRINNYVQLEQYGTAALTPLVNQNRAQSISVVTTAAQRGFVTQQATIINNSGQPEVLTFNPVGNV